MNTGPVKPNPEDSKSSTVVIEEVKTGIDNLSLAVRI
jgi:hypothetical protein